MTREQHVLVLGGGPGGYVAAIRLAQLGATVTVVEENNVGGVCLNVGCIPSKALIHVAESLHHLRHHGPVTGIKTGDITLDWRQTQAFKNETVATLTGGVRKLLKAFGVTLLAGRGEFTGPSTCRVILADGGVETIGFSHAIVATGSEPIEIPAFPYSHPRIGHSTHALSYDAVPASLLVIGGGYIGMELGQMYAMLGTKVTVVEMLPQILAGADPEAVRWVGRNLRKLNMDILTDAKAAGFEETDDGLAVTVQTPKGEKVIGAQQVMVTVGRRPRSYDIGLDAAGVALDDRGFITIDDTMKTGVDNIYAIGDVTGLPYLAHRASAQGEIAAAWITGKPDADMPTLDVIPAVTFTTPEIAMAGLQEHQAKERGIGVKVGKMPYGGNGKAIAAGATDGFIKLIADPQTDTLLGALVVGHEASVMIGGLAVAIRKKLTAADIGDTVHAHPTLGELVMEAAKAVHGEAIHMAPMRKSRR